MCFEQLWQDVPAVDHDLPFPGEVVEPDMVQTYSARLDAEQAGEGPLEPDCNIAQPDCALPRVQERPGHNADRIRKVDQPGRRRHGRHRSRDVEDDWHRAQGLGETPCTCGLLTDAAKLEWERLVTG